MMSHREIVLAGAGHATALALLALARRPAPGARITLVSRGEESRYSGMVPGWIEGLYSGDAMAIPLAPLAKAAGVHRIAGDIVGADTAALTLADGRRVPFDALIVNTGSETHRPGPLADPRVIAARPIGALGQRLMSARDTAASFAIVGAGVAGLETAFALKARRPDAAVTLIEEHAALLPPFPRRFRRAVTRALDRAGIALHLAAKVERIGADTVTVGGKTVPAAAVLALTGAAPPAWFANTPFARAGDGFFATDTRMASQSHPNVMVVGDAGTQPDDPRPKGGVFAVRAGPRVATAVRAFAAGTPLPPVRLQRRGLVLLSTGRRHAIGTRNGITLSGRWVWQLKDHLDRAFVDQFPR